MGQGTTVVFNEAMQNISGLIDLSDSSDFKCMLITTLPTAAALTPDSADFTEIAAGASYTAGGIALTTTWTEDAGVTTLDTATSITWAKDPTGATNAMAALIYSTTVIGEDAVAFIDLSTDGGVTPLSLQTGAITVAVNASGLFSIAAA